MLLFFFFFFHNAPFRYVSACVSHYGWCNISYYFRGMCPLWGKSEMLARRWILLFRINAEHNVLFRRRIKFTWMRRRIADQSDYSPFSSNFLSWNFGKYKIEFFCRDHRDGRAFFPPFSFFLRAKASFSFSSSYQAVPISRQCSHIVVACGAAPFCFAPCQGGRQITSNGC